MNDTTHQGRRRLGPGDAFEAILGLGVALWGVDQMSRPAAAIVLGAALFVFGLWGRRLLRWD